MPPLYIGGGVGQTGPSPMPGPMPNGPAPGGVYSGAPAMTTVPTSGSQPPNVLGAQAVRPTGPSQGFDPAYLQNLATAIGGLFSRPNGNLSFNPLGNLSEISQPTGFGTAPVPGLPNTMLQDAINGLAFMFNPPAASTGGGGSNIVGVGGSSDTGGGRGRLSLLQ